MPTTLITWTWDEAFDNFGFTDDAPIMTYIVENVLRDAGYHVITNPSGARHLIIVSIRDSHGTEQIPLTANRGDDEPRRYLPQSIVALLDNDPRTRDDDVPS